MSVLVLGIGNILWADEGFGVRAVEAFHRLYSMADGVDLLDGGTQGLYLVNRVSEVERLLVFDAIDYGLEPGTLKDINRALAEFYGDVLPDVDERPAKRQASTMVLMSLDLMEITMSSKPCFSSKRTCRAALSTRPRGVTPPSRSNISLGTEPELTPMRMGVLWRLAQSATMAILS